MYTFRERERESVCVYVCERERERERERRKDTLVDMNKSYEKMEIFLYRALFFYCSRQLYIYI